MDLFSDIGSIINYFSNSELHSVSTYVDLQRYSGKWYEIAKYPFFAEMGTTNATAKYTLLEDGSVEVKNEAFKNGRPVVSVGNAISVSENNSRLKVTFFAGVPPGDYWIIKLDKDYSYAVVSEPSRTHLWILSRTRRMKQDVFDEICYWLTDNGFDISRLILS